jgi:cell wall assembly regulator SMI1
MDMDMSEKINFVSANGVPAGATEEQIHRIEIELGFSFPKDMRTYYKKHDGKQLEVSKFVLERHGSITLNQMWCIKDEIGNGSFRDLCKLSIENPYWPKWLIPFANDPGGQAFCFSVNESNYGAIYLHRFEFMGEEKEALFLSRDFSEFIASLG